MSDWSRSLQKSGTEGREETGGDPVHISGREELEESLSLAFCQRWSARPATPICQSSRGVCSCGQEALIQLSAGLSLHPRALNQHPSQGVLQARTHHPLSSPLKPPPPSPALPLAVHAGGPELPTSPGDRPAPASPPGLREIYGRAAAGGLSGKKCCPILKVSGLAPDFRGCATHCLSDNALLFLPAT